jgi:hypothetical protein
LRGSKPPFLRETRTFIARQLITLARWCANLAEKIAPWLGDN